MRHDLDQHWASYKPLPKTMLISDLWQSRAFAQEYFQWVPKLFFCRMNLKYIFLKLLPHLPGAYELALLMLMLQYSRTRSMWWLMMPLSQQVISNYGTDCAEHTSIWFPCRTILTNPSADKWHKLLMNVYKNINTAYHSFMALKSFCFISLTDT